MIDPLQVVDHDTALQPELGALMSSGLLHAAAALRDIGMKVDIDSGGVVCAYFQASDPACALLLPAGPMGPLLEANSRLTGPGIASAWGPMAACIAAVRVAQTQRMPLGAAPLLLLGGSNVAALAHAVPDGMPALRFDGSVAPRMWPGCFGSFDVLVRVRGRKPSPAEPNLGINAIDEAIPLLAQLRALRQRIEMRRITLPTSDPAMPLSGRLTISAVHGGQQGTVLATVCDILLNRRYTPQERFDLAVTELHAAIDAGVSGSRAVGVDTMVSDHRRPTPEPHAAFRSRSLSALAHGYGWPHDPIGFADDAEDQATVHMGGLMRPGAEPGDEEWTTIDAVRALARSVLAYMAAPTD